jgi:TetR/AcrR family transcriptional regulator, repressor for neighboring sulfatase
MRARRTADEIVDAVAEGAHDLFVQRSPSAVSLREIAARAEVNLGLIHRYVGSKDDVIALVLARHTAAAKVLIHGSTTEEVLAGVADIVVNRPGTGRLLAGLILDGRDIAALKGDFPLVDQLNTDSHDIEAAMAYALALGWEIFGQPLLDAIQSDARPADVAPALAEAMARIGQSR